MARDVSHPGWCSSAHCYRQDDGVRVHVQAPACWEHDDDLTPTRFKTGLLASEDEPFTYLELELRTFVGIAYAILPLADAQRLRDQLNAHLDAAESGRRNRVLGVDGADGEGGRDPEDHLRAMLEALEWYRREPLERTVVPVGPRCPGVGDGQREVEQRVLDVTRDVFAVLDAHGYVRTSDDAVLGRAVGTVWALVDEYEGRGRS